MALTARVALYHPDVPSDGRRYLEQARQLVAGKGFGRKGRLESHLPPGYPLLLAGILVLDDSLTTIRVVQIGLSVASCLLAYAAIRPFSRRLALLVLWSLALSPVLAYQAGRLMSETFGTFLMSGLVFALSWHRTANGPQVVPLLLIGIVASGLVLTSPATAFLCALVLAAVTWSLRKRTAGVFLLATGLALPMAPWQIHQLAATGGLMPLIYDASLLRPPPGIRRWVTSWLIIPDHVWAYHCVRGAEAFDAKVPEQAFRSTSEKLYLRDVCIAAAAGEIETQECDAVFRCVGDSRYREAPFRCYVINPLLRGLSLWFYIDKLWPAQASYIARCTLTTLVGDWTESGPRIAVLRFGKGCYSTAVAAINATYALLFGYLMLRAARSRQTLAIAIILGVLGYTCSGALMATHEVRRNTVFYPAILFLSTFASRRRPPCGIWPRDRAAFGHRQHDNESVPADSRHQPAESASHDIYPGATDIAWPATQTASAICASQPEGTASPDA